MAFFGLLETVRTGYPAYPSVFGKNFWDDLSENPDLGASFDTLMASERAKAATEIAETVDWSSITSVVDVGGGTGRQLAQIVKGRPYLRGILVDLPATAAVAGDFFKQRGIADQCSLATGSFFDPLPAGADFYLLSFILHDWSDADAARILRQCAEAVHRHGRIAIVEHMLDDQGGRSITGMDMRMMATFGGRERASAEYRSLAETAGLAVEKVQRIPSGSSIIECVPVT
jgi:SAM-dependent methyltransferase